MCSPSLGLCLVLALVALTAWPQILPADRKTERRVTLAHLRTAETTGELATAARINGELGHEAFLRALRATTAWESLRDPETGLIPKSPKFPFWNGADSGADCLPFLWQAYHELAPARASVWLDALATDRRLCGILPQTVYFKPTRVEPGTGYEMLFGGAEYIKDGLIAMAERHGRGPWYDRMIEIADEVNAKSALKTARGPIPGDDTEINGDLLIYLPRLYWATRNPAYLEMGQRLADLYLLDVLPAHSNLPALYWDFAKGTPGKHIHADLVKYRDHGNETIFGLTELYFLERRLGLPAAERHRKPLQELLDRILVVGRTENGLWYDAVKVSNGDVKKRVIDTWGYLLNALQTFDLAEGTNRYAGEIQRAMRGAAQMKSFQWEGQRPDGYADAIEGMMYLLPWFDLPECRAWVDDETEVLYGFQQPDGFIEGLYLDGNFIRTVLLYGRFKAQGARLQPWRDDLRIGAARDPKSGGLVLHLQADKAWEGVLTLDRPMHRDLWNMPFNYPRINAAPEWFPAFADKTYAIVNAADGAKQTAKGASLAKGIPVKLDGQTALVYRVDIAKD